MVHDVKQFKQNGFFSQNHDFGVTLGRGGGWVQIEIGNFLKIILKNSNVVIYGITYMHLAS